MLPEIGEWTVEDVRAVADPLVAESAALEKKASGSIDGATKGKSTAEIAKQICAFANAGGGFIVFGVKDTKDGGGIDTGVEPTFGAQPIKDWVEKIGPKEIIPPVTNCLAQFIEYPGTARGAIVLFVPSSDRRPHWVNENNREIAYLRVGGFSGPMALQTLLDLHSRGSASIATICDFDDWWIGGGTSGRVGRIEIQLNPAIKIERGPVCERWQVDIISNSPQLHLIPATGSNAAMFLRGHITFSGTGVLFPERPTKIASTNFVAASTAEDGGESFDMTLYAGSAMPVRRRIMISDLLLRLKANAKPLSSA